jgi:hypothetical protein
VFTELGCGCRATRLLLREGRQAAGLADELAAEFPFDSFGVGAIREAPSYKVLIVAPLVAAISNIGSTFAMEFVDQSEFRA